MSQLFLPILALVMTSAAVRGQTTSPIRVPRDPCVMPDGNAILFAWRRDLWMAPIDGGAARRLTVHPANDAAPRPSPDGRRIAFLSDRSGSTQIHVLDLEGGAPRQITFDSHPKTLVGYTPDGAGLLVIRRTDRAPFRSESARLFRLDPSGEEPPRMLFDAGLTQAAMSPDGSLVLFTRGRASWWRKGYRGSQASQMWLADLRHEPVTLTRLDRDRPHFQNVSWKDPMWAPDGKGFYFVSDPDGTFDIWYRALEDDSPRRVTRVSAADGSDDGVAFPSLSADGRTLVFRRLFDLWRVDPATGGSAPIRLHARGDTLADRIERRTETSATDVAFTLDGKQMAFVAGDDVWVMDRVLREPVRVTRDPHRESSLEFSKDGRRLFYVSDAGGEVDIFEAHCKREDGIWWLARPEDFSIRRITEDAAVESSLRLSPTGKHVAYVKGADLYVMDADGTDHRRVVAMWSRPRYAWSPDGKWLAYATQDDDYNSDVWLMPLDASREPFNLSRHPDRDGEPVFSGDGKRLAFTGRHDGDETDIYWVNLSKKEEETSERDRKLAEALQAMKRKAPRSAERGASRPGRRTDPVVVTIDFEGLRDRIHRISIPDSTETGLIWSPDGKKLCFQATVGGERGFYAVEFPTPRTPRRVSSSGLGKARWLATTNEIVGMAAAPRAAVGSPATPPRGPRGPRRFRGMRGFSGGGGVPAAMDPRGSVKTFSFEVRTVRDWGAVRQLAFDQAWRAMRDRFYDENLNDRDWPAVRAKYRPVVAQCLAREEFSEVVNMMLGELNASHLGHRGGTDPLPVFRPGGRWTPTTYHLGLRFAAGHPGPGLKVESVIPRSPCARSKSLVHPGEIVIAMDGQGVGPETDVDRLLTLEREREVELTVLDRASNERKVVVRPAASVAGLLYDEWVDRNRAAVEAASDGRLGYLHIRGMNMTSFRQMEEDIYAAGHGKDGLIVDVRFNGGGSTTDHVLTALTQPVHAITVSRGSGPGYPQDRKVYASWNKPIVLMCNEYSFSNAEILSHAIKQIGRGRLVGMRTAGGVISTGSVRLLDGSSVRMPGRGWYLATTGEDMELNGCEPDIALWNPPQGPDLQLEAAVKALREDVEKWRARPRPELVPASVKRRAARPVDAAHPAGKGGNRR